MIQRLQHNADAELNTNRNSVTHIVFGKRQKNERGKRAEEKEI